MAKRDYSLMIVAIGLVAVLAVAYLAGFFQSEIASYNPTINANDFVSNVDNPFFPLVPGTTYTFEGVSEDGNERNEVTVTNETKVIMGVSCTVVWDRVWLDGSLIEETYDWYAQDKNGNVWYFGEDSREIENGVVVSTAGSWEAGVDGAKPGIVMMGQPSVGEVYRQEYYRGEAEDMAEVLSLDASVGVPYGPFGGCLQTNEWTPLEKGVAENKFYAPGVGLVKELQVEGGTGYMDLIRISTG